MLEQWAPEQACSMYTDQEGHLQSTTQEHKAQEQTLDVRLALRAQLLHIVLHEACIES